MGSIGISTTAVRTVNTIFTENPKIEKNVERAFNKANLMAEPDIYKALYSYKNIAALDSADVELLYEHLADRLFGSDYTRRK